jgi:hypothetical protein
MVLGISFLETPVKFTVPSVTLPLGLNVGRHLFGVFNRVEICWALLACGLMIYARAEHAAWLPMAAVAVVVMLQTTWLLPLLDASVTLILAGQTPPPAPHHVVYIVFEVLKLVCLVAAGVKCLRALKHAPSIA